jgi:hypothetical protein
MPLIQYKMCHCRAMLGSSQSMGWKLAKKFNSDAMPSIKNANDDEERRIRNDR